ncbi:MAG: TIGR03118 family protein [Methylobacter sp.]|nr:TIGR03118 family protein [Methylobacter sp.]
MLNNRFSNFSSSLLITLIFLMSTGISYAAPGFQLTGYRVHNLVSDIPNEADHMDPDLVNAWGIAFNPDLYVWVNDGGTGKSTLYDGNGIKQSLVVTIPGSSGQPSKPTGIVYFGGNSDFKVTANGTTASSRFIFATEDGTISGWAPSTGTTAIEVVPNLEPENGPIYKGLALSADGIRYLLYATDFHNGKVDVFDGKFQPVSLDVDAFTDPKIPTGFAPFGIQAINGVIFVTYAKQDDDKEDDVAGPGLGYVNAYDASGHLLRRVAARGKLNAPWGLALAPADFGKFSNHLLVGNFGDGAIIAYDLNNHFYNPGAKLRQPNGTPINIEGLWGISFGNGLKQQPTNVLFFAAGPNDEANGLYGKIEVVSDHSDDNNN